MAKIQVLDSHLTDLIAAGEVVERPASVVKELMENAIDAGAGVLTVEIANGGMSLIRITDDGCGIPREELATAFLRHATSKLRTQRDLEAIGTLGFRGEALAAISAVSRIDVLTRTPGAELGSALSLAGGVPGQVEEAGCPAGTTLVVRDLFYNTPARLKFLKKDAAEGAAVFAVVQRLALAHPEVSVKFLRDGKQELLTPGDGQLKSALYAVLGREVALGMLPFRGSGEDDITASGFVSLPTCCRGSRNTQFFFVNGRHVKSALLTAAVENAYANQKMVGKFPGCVVHITMKLNTVDVNVHPAKTEVKFDSERRVFDAVYHAVRSALEGDRTHPQAELKTTRPAPSDTVTPNQTSFQAMTAREFRESAPAARLILSDVVRPAPPAAPKAAPAKPPVTAPAEAPAPRPVPPAEQAPAPAPQPAKPAPRAEPAPPAAQPVPWRVAGEVLNTYIIVEQGDSVLLIDKHAAHERMNFDRMKAADYRPMVQTLLTPVTFTPGAEEGAALLAHLPLLAEFGFEAEDFGGGALIVRQAPFDVDAGDIGTTLTELAAQLMLTGSADPAAARDQLLHTMACKAAIKGGQKNGPAELEAVARAVLSGQVKYCPHGRPVAIELTRSQLEKQFKRA